MTSGQASRILSHQVRITLPCGVKISPHEILAEHEVDIHKVLADFRDAFERIQSSSVQTYGV